MGEPEPSKKLPKGVAGYNDQLGPSAGQGRRFSRKKQDGVQAYNYNQQHPANASNKIRAEADPVNAKLTGGRWERPIYFGGKQSKGAWFYESGKRAKKAEMLESMQRVSRGKMFVPSQSRRVNGERLLGLLAKVLKPSGKRVPPGPRAIEDVVEEEGQEWAVRLPLKEKAGGAGGGGEEEWLCLEYSQDQVGLPANERDEGGVKLLNIHRAGYLLVLLGYQRVKVEGERGGKRAKAKVIRWEGVWELAHRVVDWCYEGVGGGGEVVLHTCDNKGCLSIAHLMRGSQRQNLKGREGAKEAEVARKESQWVEGARV
jgi:hypothetical protein